MNIRKLVYKKNDSNISYISVKNIFGIYLILIIHMILATGCASTRNTGKFEEIGRGYPRWFIYQSENPELVVGFTRNGKGLQRDAEIRYCGYHKGFSIQGVLYVYPSGDFNFSDYHFYYEQQELD
ncbi:MAG: hypothetical protein RAO94_00655, partial [Candidatus Stygibacter australis]|nr:hypothetical protein [Candidatus Stygibacter australis]